jgi:virginiamycin A acetyltransferase
MGFSSLLRKAGNFLLNQNDVQLRGKGKIANDVLLKGANIKGEVIVGCKSILKFVEVRGPVTIGNYTTINGPNVQVFAKLNPITIGNYCSIARDVAIQEYNHKTNAFSSYNFQKHVFGGKPIDDAVSKGPIVIGSDVWIGTKAIVLSGVSVGHGAIVAAGSVVTKDVKPYAIVGGNPARVIRQRFSPEVVDRLLEIEWWEWPMEKVRQHQYIFAQEPTLSSLKDIS